ncbi:MAG: hypothetical protein DWQ06_03915 [Calditrichaeota bacterium]|nr:MAG: hypothetical protein DWQ06_03915 [Calditrichota bacterium]
MNNFPKVERFLLALSVISFVVLIFFTSELLLDFCWLEILFTFSIFTTIFLNLLNQFWFKEPVFAVEQLIFVPITLVTLAFGGILLLLTFGTFFREGILPPVPREFLLGTFILMVLTIPLQIKIHKKEHFFELAVMSFSALSLLAICFEFGMVWSAFENFTLKLFVLSLVFSVFTLVTTKIKWDLVKFSFWIFGVLFALVGF